MDRLDIWVLKISIAIPLVCVAVLVGFHLVARLFRKPLRTPRAIKDAPDPWASLQTLRAGTTAAEAAQQAARELLARSGDDPERLQQACASLEDELAKLYLELAESLLRRDQSQEAAAIFRKVVQKCPDTVPAQTAQARLREITVGLKN
jgi:hypothetical protein